MFKVQVQNLNSKLKYKIQVQRFNSKFKLKKFNYKLLKKSNSK